MKTNKHLAAILCGRVTKTNVNGIKNLLNAQARRDAGLSVGVTAPKDTCADEIIDAIHKSRPKIDGPLHDSGVKLLTSPRNRKALARVAHVVADIQAFYLVDFEPIGDLQHVPVYLCAGKAGKFVFRNVPWQSGGNGPEVIG